MQKLLLIKLGGSLITEKDREFKARHGVIRRLAKEVKEAKRKFAGDIIIGHGAGSFAHPPAAKYKTQEGLINKKSVRGFAVVADCAREINRIVVKALLKEGINAVSFSPLSFIFTANRKVIKSTTETIGKALKIGITPVVYGDVIMDQRKGFCIYSGETTLNLLAEKFNGGYKETRIIYCGETNGVYDQKGKTIAQINLENLASFKSAIGRSKATDVTGGMIHKVEESMEIAKKFKIKTLIINGLTKNSLKDAVLGRKTVSTEVSF